MIKVTNITNLAQVYDYQMRWSAPNFFPTEFSVWKESFENDADGEGRQLFRQLRTKTAYEGDRLIGFVQYGNTAFGFDAQGEISNQVSYPVIRSLYFDEGREDAGKLLLQAAIEELEAGQTVYAFFHYFGMRCFARHGKLFEHFPWIAELLHAAGFGVEHENVYYSAPVQESADAEVALTVHDLSKGGQQVVDFMLEDTQIGGCEVHYVNPNTAYLRWIYVNEELQNQGIGSKCMTALKNHLRKQGITRLDTDTALDNLRAQRYYEKNGFTREGITRSYLTK